MAPLIIVSAIAHYGQALTLSIKGAVMSSKSWALELIDRFSDRTSGDGIWMNLRRRDVAEGLRARVDNPDEIDQLSTNTCGVASFVRNWAIDDPVGYAWLGIQLYETGRGRIDNPRSKSVKIISSHEALRKHPLPHDSQGRPMNPADWIILASVRHSFNSVMQYPDPVFGEAISAINFPGDVVGMFRAAGYQKIVDGTNWLSSRGYENATKAGELCDAGWRVVFLINSRLLDDAGASSTALITSSDHWVVLVNPEKLPSSPSSSSSGSYFTDADELSSAMGAVDINYFWRRNAPVEVDRIGVRFRCYTWGSVRRVPQNGGYFPWRVFQQHYFGYVAALY